MTEPGLRYGGALLLVLLGTAALRAQEGTPAPRETTETSGHTGAWKIIAANGTFLADATLGSVRDDSLFVVAGGSGTALPIGTIVRVSRDNGSYFWTGAGIGALAGLAGFFIQHAANNYASRCSSCGDGEGIVLMIGIPTSALLGALLGGGVGALIPDRDELDLSSMAPAEKAVRLQKLVAEEPR